MTSTQLQKTPQAGDVAPDFTARSTAGTEVSLSDYRGRNNVLIAFFPAAFTSTCTEELRDFTRDRLDFGDLGVEIIPISVDSVASLKEFKSKEKLSTELVSDFKRDISRAYGVLNEEKFNSKRAYLLIDKQGIVRWAHVEEHGGFKRTNAEILAEVAKLP